MGRSGFPKAKPTQGAPIKRDPRPTRTHALHGETVDWDGVAVCLICGNRADHRIHDVAVAPEAAEIDARKLGEADG